LLLSMTSSRPTVLEQPLTLVVMGT
jgi:hypothetical protein